MLLYWIWFSNLPKLNTGLKCRLLEHFHSPEDIYHAEPRAFSALAEVEPAILEALDNKDLTQAKQILQTCMEKDIRILTKSVHHNTNQFIGETNGDSLLLSAKHAKGTVGIRS